MQSIRSRSHSTTLNIFSGFAATGLLAFAITHTGIAYLSLLCISAFFADRQLEDVERWVAKIPLTKLSMVIVGLLAVLSTVFIPTPALAQWQGVQDAATDNIAPKLGATGTSTVDFLFAVVFMLLFFLIVGGLMSWGYKAYRNEEASVPMTAFIIGTVIFAGGEIFSQLFFP